MTWGRLDDRLHGDPRCEVAGLEAMGLWTMAISHMAAYETDGVIAPERVRRIAGRRAAVLTERLISAGWWERMPDGNLRLIGWSAYLLSRAENEANRARRSQAGRIGAERTNAKRLESGSASAAAGADVSRGAPHHTSPYPDPKREEDPPKPPKGVLPRSPRGGGEQADDAKTGRPPKAADRYLAAFVAGLADAGHTITPPRTSDGALLGRICGTHAKSMGLAIRGDDLLTWIQREAKAFRQAITRPEVHRGGISVFGLQTWLDNGRPVQPPTFRPNDPEAWEQHDPAAKWPEANMPPLEYRPPPEEPARAYSPEEQAEIDALAALPIGELERRIEAARGCHGWGAP